VMRDLRSMRRLLSAGPERPEEVAHPAVHDVTLGDGER